MQRAEPLAVDDAHAAQAPQAAAAQEFADGVRGLEAVHAVQVELALDHPVPATEFPQHAAGQAIGEVGELVARIDGVIERSRSHRLGERGALVAQPLARYGRRPVCPDDLAGLRERLGAGDGAAEILVFRKRAHRGIFPRRARPCSRCRRW